MSNIDDDLLRGIAAAPAPYEPDGWKDLLPADLSGEQLEAARARIEQYRAAPAHDLDLSERLAAVRRRLLAAGVNGFVLQRTDEFGSEYLPPAAERMAWLTGFTGSAGVTVVLERRAAVFVDGRYTVQVREQVDASRFDIVHLIEHPPATWIEENLPEGAALGFDPMLTKSAERDRLGKAVAGRNGRLVALPENPIDAVWSTRPAAPISALRRLADRYAGESSAAKRTRMGGKLAEKKAEWLALTAPDSIAWLLNIRGGDIPYNPLGLAFALLREDGTCRLFVDPRKVPRGLALDNAVSLEPQSAFIGALSGLGRDGARVLVDPSATHLAFTDRLRESGAVVIEGEDPCVLAKACKNETEIAGAFDAQRRDGAAMVRFLAWLDALSQDGGETEVTAADRLDAERARDPLFRGPSFPSISAHGPHAAIPHYRPYPETARPLTANAIYLIDSGGQYLDATTDITRTTALGQPTAEQRRRFTLVLKGHIAIATAVFPVGTSGAQLDSLARTALWRAGLDFDHGTGHGVGAFLCVHEGPARISKAGTVPLRPGMILSNEPGYYKAGEYGIRIENLLAVRVEAKPEGAERDLLAFDTLTLCPIDRRLVEPTLLSPDELAWLDDYHARVERELRPLVGEASEWLRRMCAPIATG
jgi:Xaa-Pro aminopeptidase